MMRGVLAAAAAVSFCTPASAIVVSTFETHITSMQDYKGALGPLSVGQSLRVDYFYDYQHYPEGKSADHIGGLSHVGFGADSPVTAVIHTGSSTIDMSSPSLGQFYMGAEEMSDFWLLSLSGGVMNGGQSTHFSVENFGVGKGLFSSGLNPHVSFTLTPSDVQPGSITLFQFGDPVTQHVQLQLDRLTVVGDVPEPSTWALMILGFGAIGAALRAGRRQAARSGISGKAARKASMAA